MIKKLLVWIVILSVVSLILLPTVLHPSPGISIIDIGHKDAVVASQPKASLPNDGYVLPWQDSSQFYHGEKGKPDQWQSFNKYHGSHWVKSECGPYSATLVLRHFGINVTIGAVELVALNGGHWSVNAGTLRSEPYSFATAFHDIGDHYGFVVESEKVDVGKRARDDLINDLKSGPVIIGINFDGGHWIEISKYENGVFYTHDSSINNYQSITVSELLGGGSKSWNGWEVVMRPKN